MYRWLREDEAKDGMWNRRIEYNLNHYKILLDKTTQLRGRMRSDSGVDVSALEVEQVARELNSLASSRRKRDCNEEDDVLLKPLEKQTYKRLIPPKIDEPERQATATRPAASANPDGSMTSSATPPVTTPRSPPDAHASVPRVPPAIPYLKPGFKSSWPGHLRTACEYCRKAKRACKHKNDPLHAPPLKAIGRPRKYPFPDGAAPSTAASHKTAPNQENSSQATQYTLTPIVQYTPTSAAQSTPISSPEQAMSAVASVPASDPAPPAFQLPDPHAAMRDALAAFQRNN